LSCPCNLRDILHELSDEAVLDIANLGATHGMAPTDVPRNLGIDFRTIHERVDHVVIVLNVNVAGLECCGAGGEVNRDCVFRDWDRPKQSTFRDPRIEIVNLHVLHGTCEYIKSYEAEGTVVIAPIRADKLTAHEPHISLEGKVFGCLAVDGVSAHASDRRPAHKSIEIGNCGRLSTSSREEHMEWRIFRGSLYGSAASA